MQALGYKKLANKVGNKRMKRILMEISTNEFQDSKYLEIKLRELKRKGEKFVKISFKKWKIGLMMNILGSRGFFEWAIIAEDEYVEDLAILAENLSVSSISETWARIATDERLHIIKMKKEILGMEGWEMEGGGGVRDIIFGANDGLVSILALVAGVYGAIMDSYTIFIAGVAGAIAGAISMGAGAYLSSKSEKEVTKKENDRKGFRKRQTPEKEMGELVKFYLSKGFKKNDAKVIASRVHSEIKLKTEYTIREEIGLTSEESWPPIKAGTLTGLSFAVVSLIPILPFAFMDVKAAVITAAIASIISLFGVGASKAIFTRKSWIRSGLEMMIIGSLAAAATYFIGLLIPT